MTMKRYIRIISIILIIFSLFLVSCEKEEEFVYHPAEKPGDVAVMGTVDEDNGNNNNKNNNGKKKVALTYDDGPHNVYTKKIVDEMEKYGFNATFFVVGNRVDGSDYNGASALLYAYEKGNEIGIHGYTHEEYYNECSDNVYSDELSSTEKAIKSKISSAKIKLMRPVGGKITEARVQESKYSVIMWSVDSEDWRYKYFPYSDYSDEEKAERVETIVDNVMNNVREGSIILMHDIYESTYDASVIILKRLYDEGYDVVTVSELMGNDLSAGKKFSQKSN